MKQTLFHIKKSVFTISGLREKFGILSAAILVVLLGGFIRPVQAQIIPIDDIKEEQFRIQQLFHGSKLSSFTNRPVWDKIYRDYMELGAEDYGMWSQTYSPPQYEYRSFFRLGIYEPNIDVTTNSTVPYGENNEAAWYGKGINTEFKGGFWLTSDYLTITFRPHLVSQQNLAFEIPRFIPEDDLGNIRYVAEGMGNAIDMPFRFGPSSFQTSSLGYSSIRVHFRNIEAGLSTEPMWWGANVKYPLIMSNNAAGMKHFFLGTRGPLKIPYVGSFEFKYMGGFPEDSEYFDLGEEFQQERFMNAANLSYSPFFAPNIHLGITRAVHTYMRRGVLKPIDYGLIFDPILVENFIEKRGPFNSVKPRNHLNSLYARWVWPESKMEIYGEYFRDDYAYDSRDLLMEPRHNSGYAFGFQKLILGKYFHFYKMNVEFTNMTPGYLEEVRPQTYYYTDQQIRQGHTHRGQVLGAAIGPGSNSQFVSVDGYFNSGRVGIFVRRMADNNHFHYEYDRFLDRPEEYRGGYGDYWRNRTDLTIGTKGVLYYRKFLISASLSWTKLFNYGRYNYGEFGPGINIANFEPMDKSNVQFSIGISYKF
ncbi:MAG: capsule assembly Wzi family protein [Balneolaceae bacterium]|nr:capsule assembly Wzi family protein [Balneolaceae bacterium]